jgi:hypothetical protein
MVDVAVPTRREDHRVAGKRADLAREKTAHDDAPHPFFFDDEIEHLGSRMHLDSPGLDLPLERLVAPSRSC